MRRRSEDDYPRFLFPGEKSNSINYGYYHGYTLLDKENKKAAYPFGFGLSYTDFAYSDLKVAKTDEGLKISVKAENTGGADGKTVVQAYIGAQQGDHPLRQLKAFKKVFLKKGESQYVELSVDKDDLRYYDEHTGKFYLEKEYRVYVGRDVEDSSNLTADVTM